MIKLVDIELMNQFDIGDQPPDLGTDIAGSVLLVKTSGGTRSVLANSTVTAHT